MRRIVWAALLAVLIPVVAQRSASQDVQGSPDANQKRSALLSKIEADGHVSKRLADAFTAVPRQRFLPSYLAGMAYVDTSLPLGNGQTLPSPSDLLRSIGGLDVQPGDTVLVIGADAAYAAALLSRMASHVDLIELDSAERASSRSMYGSLGYRNITVASGGSLDSFASSAPFPRIFVSGATPTVPASLLAQLSASGRMVVPLRDPTGFQMVVALERSKGRTSLSAVGKGFYSPITLEG